MKHYRVTYTPPTVPYQYEVYASTAGSAITAVVFFRLQTTLQDIAAKNNITIAELLGFFDVELID